jgi:hypothetical protein
MATSSRSALLRHKAAQLAVWSQVKATSRIFGKVIISCSPDQFMMLRWSQAIPALSYQ